MDHGRPIPEKYDTFIPPLISIDLKSIGIDYTIDDMNANYDTNQITHGDAYNHSAKRPPLITTSAHVDRLTFKMGTLSGLRQPR